MAARLCAAGLMAALTLAARTTPVSAGASPLPGNDRGKFGVGVFYLGYSSKLKDGVQPAFSPRDEHDTEIFYNFAVTPWFRLTADLLVIRPSPKANDTAVVGGLRAQIIF